MLMPFVKLPANTTSTVVRYTDKTGTFHYVTWSVVAGGKARYIAAYPGTYEIVTNRVEFSDVSENFGARRVLIIVQRYWSFPLFIHTLSLVMMRSFVYNIIRITAYDDP